MDSFNPSTHTETIAICMSQMQSYRNKNTVFSDKFHFTLDSLFLHALTLMQTKPVCREGK
jgi:hypothetical protein